MEYTQEEKKAIENLNEILTHKNDVDIVYGYNIERPYPIGREKIAQLEIIKNLLEKQQNEIERLEKTIDENIVIEPDETGCHEELNIHIKDFIPKEVIREKIKELENQKISIKVGFEKIFETKMDNAKIIDTLRELLRGE